MPPPVSSRCRPSRNCQDGSLRAGAVKARRPRVSAVGAERRALHGAEHRPIIDYVMAGASAVVLVVAVFRARIGGRGVRRELARNRWQYLPPNGVQYESWSLARTSAC